MSDVLRWLSHSPMSDPGRHVAAISGLPADIGLLNELIQGVLVHADWATAYGLVAAGVGASARQTLPTAERLDDILRRDQSPLGIRRPAARRSPGTCRDFALTLCSILRSLNIPARVRCGFAAYFDTEWEDHWVCQYWDRGSGSWRLSDPQIDHLFRVRNGIEFDTADLPRQVFILAGEAWLACRQQGADPASFGHGSTTGWWFLKLNVLRDHYAVNNRETSSLDRWRETPQEQRSISKSEWIQLDGLAIHPEQPLVEDSMQPPNRQARL